MLENDGQTSAKSLRWDTSSVCEQQCRQTLCWPRDRIAGRGVAHRPVPFSVVLKVILAPVAEDTPRMKAFT